MSYIIEIYFKGKSADFFEKRGGGERYEGDVDFCMIYDMCISNSTYELNPQKIKEACNDE